MYKHVLLILLTGCASNPDSRMTQIEHDYRVFANGCLQFDGTLSIDRPFNKRRVQNAPVTVWEMQDAVCSYPGEHSLRMYNK